MQQTKPYVLYGTDGCHLCEQAKALCDMALAQQFEQCDIIDDEQLVALYATHIPVLAHRATHTALYWPFDFLQLQEFLRGTN